MMSTQSRTRVNRVPICQASGHRLHGGSVECPVLFVRAARLPMLCRTEASHRFQRLVQYSLTGCLLKKNSDPYAALVPRQLRDWCRNSTLVPRTERSVGTKFSDLRKPCLSEGASLRNSMLACLLLSGQFFKISPFNRRVVEKLL